MTRTRPTPGKSPCSALVAHDLDGDRLVDLLLVDNVQPAAVLPAATVTAVSASALASPTADAATVQVADLDDDGILDTIVAKPTVTNLTALARQTATAMFQAPVVLTRRRSGGAHRGRRRTATARAQTSCGDGSRLGTLLNADDGTGTMVAQPTCGIILTAARSTSPTSTATSCLDVAVAVSSRATFRTSRGGGGKRLSLAAHCVA